jgi:hypothetical protein
MKPRTVDGYESATRRVLPFGALGLVPHPGGGGSERGGSDSAGDETGWRPRAADRKWKRGHAIPFGFGWRADFEDRSCMLPATQ